MIWTSIFLILFCSHVPCSQGGVQESEEDGTAEMENQLSAEEQSKKLEKFLLGHIDITVPPAKHPLMPPKTESKFSFNVTLISVSQKENGVILPKPDEKDEDQEEEEVEEADEETSKEDEMVQPTTVQPATTLPADDNLNYISCLKGKRYYRKCYLIFQHFENYATAQQLCHSRGGNLAMPIDENEFAVLAKYVHDAFFPFNWPIWIGIHDRRSEGMYTFENSHRVSYFNWYKDHLVTQPNGGALENCVSISSDDGKWWDNDCSRRMYYICEY
ncbi:C-type lectin domain family 11 member A isoform 2-T2 [Anomaloglossus baeobatrachus]|uniref:C-type lectin domain family 11 member A isoform X2 n=1 Tax=Anomaloglossus baeobatrachus TaxID=238106 RepID=UPI003F502AA1